MCWFGIWVQLSFPLFIQHCRWSQLNLCLAVNTWLKLSSVNHHLEYGFSFLKWGRSKEISFRHTAEVIPATEEWLGAFLLDGLMDEDVLSLELPAWCQIQSYKLPTWCRLFVREKFSPAMRRKGGLSINMKTKCRDCSRPQTPFLQHGSLVAVTAGCFSCAHEVVYELMGLQDGWDELHERECFSCSMPGRFITCENAKLKSWTVYPGIAHLASWAVNPSPADRHLRLVLEDSFPNIINSPSH